MNEELLQILWRLLITLILWAAVPYLLGLLICYAFIIDSLWIKIGCVLVVLIATSCRSEKTCYIISSIIVMCLTASFAPTNSIIGKDGNQQLVAKVKFLPEVTIAEGKKIEEYLIRAEFTDKMDYIHRTMYIVKKKDNTMSLCSWNRTVIKNAVSIEIFEHRYKGRPYDVFKVKDTSDCIHIFDYAGRDVYGDSYKPIVPMPDIDDYGW